MEGGDLRMSSIENKVVQMKFDNAQFEAGVKTTLASLQALNKGLKLEGATKGLEGVGHASTSMLSHLGPIGSAVQSIADKFKTLSIVGIAALANIANRAVSAGLTLLKSLTVAPVMAGLHEYETNLNSIQTILANTGLTGQEGLNKVNAALQKLNDYSDQTIYNFSEMARNIGTFTAAGVTLDVATQAIKGISNLAAISGSSAAQASTAMYQLSQAISAGKVTLEDWNSVVNAGMGGKVFQNALMETARIHGVAIDKMVKDAGSFRLTLQEGWLTGEILTETLSKFTGDLTAAQLKTMGYNDQQIVGILKMAKTAQEAATKIKTFSQLINTLQETAGSGWAKTWQMIFGDFEEAKTLFTNVNDVLGGFINASADARNKVLGDWKELGGRKVIIEAIGNAFTALIAVIKPIGQAFRDIFPATTGKQLYEISVALRDFTAGLKIGGETADKLRRTFAGVFAIFGIGFDIVKEAAKTLLSLFGVASGGAGSFLDVTAKIGDFLVAVRKAIHDGTALSSFFKGIGAIIAVPIKIILSLASAIASLFDKFDGGDATKSVGSFVGKFEPLGKLAQAVISAWSKVPKIFDDVIEKFLPFAEKAGKFFRNLGKMISDGLGDINFDKVLAAVNTGLLSVLVAAIVSFIKKLKGGVDAGTGLLDTITAPFTELTKTLSAMQNTLRATTLLQIAAAIGILTLSVIGLSKIDSAGLTRALTAMAVMFTQLFTTLVLFEKFASTGVVKLYVTTAALILLAIAIDLLTIAVKSLSELSWNELAKGLTGVTVLLGALTAAVNFMPNDAKMFATSLALIALAAAIKILASAVTDLSGLSWQEMAKGLVGVGTLLAALTLFTRFAAADKAAILQGAGLLLLAAGIKVLASAIKDLSELSWMEIARGLTAMAGGLTLMGAALLVIPPTSVFSAAAVLVLASSLGMISDALKDMAEMSWMEIARGMTALAGALTLIAAALLIIPPTSLFSAAAVFVVAASLGMMTDALQDMASMSWSEIGKSLVELAGALGIIAGAMLLMTVALPGAAALLVVSASLMILAPILAAFGNMSLQEIGKSLLMLAGVFVVLGVAGVALAPIVPILLALGVAVTLIGIGMLAAGAGVLLFATGLTALAISGAAATLALVAMVSALAGLIPMVLTQVGLGLIAFAQIIGTAGPAITNALVTILNSLIDAIIRLSPKIIEALFVLLTALYNTMLKYVPQMVNAGLKLLTGVLNGIANNIGGVVAAAVSVAVNFINAMAGQQGRIIQAGVNFILSFINGLASAIRSNSAAMGQAGANLATAIVEGMVRGLAGGAGKIASEAKRVAKNALNAAKSVLGIGSPSKEFEKLGKFSDEGLANGLSKLSHVVEASAQDVGKNAMSALGKSLSGVSSILSNKMDTQPTIRPVLDLTDINRNAGLIDKVLAGSRKISIVPLASRAQDASAGFQNNKSFVEESSAPSTTTPMVQFNQTNNSPKALSTAEIYRQTKNQLSQVKKVVALHDVASG
jgi:tape measure domain-containing protein